MKIRDTFKRLIVFLLCLTFTTSSVGFASRFSDVSEGDIFYEGVNYLSERQLISGYDDNTFRPNDTMTVAQLISLIVEASGIDVEETEGIYYQKYINSAIRERLILEDEFTVDDYNRPISRGELSKILIRAMSGKELNPVNYSMKFVGHVKDYDEFKDRYGNVAMICYAKGLMDLTTDGRFEVDAPIRRGEASLIIYRYMNMDARMLPKLEGDSEKKEEKKVEVVKAEVEDPYKDIDPKYIELFSNQKYDMFHGSVDVWEWNKIDEEYLIINELSRKELREEIKILEEELFKIENQRINVNGFIYYPTFLVFRMVSTDRAIIARENLLKGENVYPSKYGASIHIPMSRYNLTWDNDRIMERVVSSDVALLRGLEEYPYDMFKGMRIIVSPYALRGAGVCTYDGNTHIVTGSITPKEILYHELGHYWASYYIERKATNYEEHLYKDYLKIRGKKAPTPPVEYLYKPSENFAEDFKWVMGVNVRKDHLAAYENPSQEIQEDLRKYIFDTMEKYPDVDTSYDNGMLYFDENNRRRKK